jgi:hypothetical protein
MKVGGLDLTGKAAVLKTAGGNPVQVRILCPPLQLREPPRNAGYNLATYFDTLPPEKQRQLRDATRELNEIALRYAVDVFVASRRASPVPGPLNHATGVLLQLQGKTVLATASHVLAKFEERVKLGDAAMFQTMAAVLPDPLGRVHWRDEALDLVLLDLTEAERAQVGSWVYEPRPPWPPPVPPVSSFVITAGFPVEGRTTDTGRRAVELKALQSMLVITGVGDDHFYCPIDRDNWYDVSGVGLLPAGANLGGMSGAPVFAVERLHYPLVGIVTEYSPGLEVFRVQGLAAFPAA